MKFFPVYSYLVIYRPDTKPLQVVSILHGTAMFNRFSEVICSGFSLDKKRIENDKIRSFKTGFSCPTPAQAVEAWSLKNSSWQLAISIQPLQPSADSWVTLGRIGWNWVNIGGRGRGDWKNGQFGEWIIEKQELEQSLTSETTAESLTF